MSSPSPLSSFPESVQQAHSEWLSTGDLDALDRVIMAIVAHHRPGRDKLADPDLLPAQARLMADLGFDSLAVAEIVFFIEDVYKVALSNDDLKSIETVADLRAFVRAKIAAMPPR